MKPIITRDRAIQMVIRGLCKQIEEIHRLSDADLYKRLLETDPIYAGSVLKSCCDGKSYCHMCKELPENFSSRKIYTQG